MDERLDPACPGASELTRKHREQSMLLGGSEGQLAEVVRMTQDKQLRDHLVSCARCRHYDPCCAACGFDVRREPHGWLCPEQPSLWRDYLPWNWRPKKAPPRPQGWETRAADGTRTVPVRETPRAREPLAPAPTARAGAATPAQRAKQRVATQKPSPPPLAQAYAALGLTSSASPEQVRAAFREKAKEYHPDRVASLAPEFREVAERRMKEINGAYEAIKKSWA